MEYLYLMRFFLSSH